MGATTHNSFVYCIEEEGNNNNNNDNNDNNKMNDPITYLGNGKSFPLVGMGVGNLQHDLIISQIVNGIGGGGGGGFGIGGGIAGSNSGVNNVEFQKSSSSEIIQNNHNHNNNNNNSNMNATAQKNTITKTTMMNYRLIDTAHASHNEQLVHDGILQGLLKKSNATIVQKSNDIVHVITKVWYTYLGYERTIISVTESLEQLLSISKNRSNNNDNNNNNNDNRHHQHHQQHQQNNNNYHNHQHQNNNNNHHNHNHNNNIRVHVLLHWPRCMDEEINWMDCEREENELPSYVRESNDPVPHLHKNTAFLESWRALEDIYLGIVNLGNDHYLPMIESIGISNFNMNDLNELLKISRVVPHILQGNVWTYVFDEKLINYCYRHRIHFQAYNVMNGIINEQSKKNAPMAYQLLQQIANELSLADNTKIKATLNDDDDNDNNNDNHHHRIQYTPSQVILKWLIQNDVSVIPRTTKLNHLNENSPTSIGTMTPVLPLEEEKIVMAVKALLTGKDIERPIVTFTNNHQHHDDNSKNHDNKIHIFWNEQQEKQQYVVKENLSPGESFNIFTLQGHKFTVYDQNKIKQKEYTITADYGQKQNFYIHEL